MPGVEEITFHSEMQRSPSKDPVVIKVVISNIKINKVYMDCGSSCEIIYEHCLMKLKPSIRAKQVKPKMPLVGFSGECLCPLGEITLEVTLEEGRFARTETLNFVIVRSQSPYNMLIGRTAMQTMGIVVSTVHATVKFQTTHGIGTIFSSYDEGDIQEDRRRKEKRNQKSTKHITEHVEAEEQIVINNSYPEQKVMIGKKLPTTFKKRLERLLKAYEDVFVWKYSDITGVPRSLIIDGKSFSMEHKLNESKHIKPTTQKPRHMTPERSMAIHKEVDKLTEAGILRKVEIHHGLLIQLRPNEGMENGKYRLTSKTLIKLVEKEATCRQESNSHHLNLVGSASSVRTRVAIRYRWQKRTKKKRPFMWVKAPTFSKECLSV